MQKVSEAKEMGLKDFYVIDGKIYANIETVDDYIESMAWKVMASLMERFDRQIEAAE